MEKIILVLSLCLLVSFIISEVFYRLRYPKVIGQILAGIVLGLPFFVDFLFPGGYMNALNAGGPSAIAVDILSGIGIIFLLLLTGLEIDCKKFRKTSRDVAMISISCTLIPFLFGFISIEALGNLGYIQELQEYNLHLVALVVGACLSLTAGGTKVMILMELDKLNTKLGEIMLGAGLIDEILGIMFLSIVLLLTAGSVSSPLASVIAGIPAFGGIHQSMGAWLHILLFPVEFTVFILIVYMLFKFFPAIMRYIQREKSEVSEFMIIILTGLLIAAFSEFIGLGTIIGALIAGIVIQLSIKDRKEEQKLANDLKVLTMGLVVPFFFLSIGLNFSVNSLFLNPILLLSIVFAATAGKILGAVLVKGLTDLSLRQLYLVGWGMNSRGAVELVIVLIARPLLPVDVFSSIVAMAIITTVLSPIILENAVKIDPGVME